jgi:hypothetical protein
LIGYVIMPSRWSVDSAACVPGHLLAGLAVAVGESGGVEHGVREELVVEADRLIDVARGEAGQRAASEPRHRRTGLRDLPAEAVSTDMLVEA